MFVQIREKGAEAQAYVKLVPFIITSAITIAVFDYFLQGLHHGLELNNTAVLAAAYNGAGYIYSVMGDNNERTATPQNSFVT